SDMALAFEDVAVYFSERQAALLHPEQREVMLENSGDVAARCSLGVSLAAACLSELDLNFSWDSGRWNDCVRSPAVLNEPLQGGFGPIQLSA
uniref:KRAB domain-containing protein n=1 Tax=Varanus komodoensis TaxID=61221 RepID=A0A8D2LBK4_VARKO